MSSSLLKYWEMRNGARMLCKVCSNHSDGHFSGICTACRLRAKGRPNSEYSDLLTPRSLKSR